MEFRHVLVSRLNVYYLTKMSERGFDPENWLLERVEIFKKFCLPSILNQSNKKFQWFFYIDAHTPDQVKEDLEKTFAPYSFIKLLAHQFDSFNITKQVRYDINRYLGKDFDFLISSRVDTDDMLHKDYIKNVQRMFSGQEYEALNFNKGLVYDVPTGVSSEMKHRHNAFISLIEKRTDHGFLTVFHKQHTDYGYDPRNLQIRINQPMWLVTIHGMNDSTGFYGRVFKFKQPSLEKLFSFKFQKKPNISDIFYFSLKSYKRTIHKVISRV